MNIPLKDILVKPKVERSWSEDVPDAGGANGAGTVEFVRDEAMIGDAFKATQKLRDQRLSMDNKDFKPGPLIPLTQMKMIDNATRAMTLAKKLIAKKYVKIKQVDKFMEFVEFLTGALSE